MAVWFFLNNQHDTSPQKKVMERKTQQNARREGIEGQLWTVLT